MSEMARKADVHAVRMRPGRMKVITAVLVVVLLGLVATFARRRHEIMRLTVHLRLSQYSAIGRPLNGASGWPADRAASQSTRQMSSSFAGTLTWR